MKDHETTIKTKRQYLKGKCADTAAWPDFFTVFHFLRHLNFQGESMWFTTALVKVSGSDFTSSSLKANNIYPIKGPWERVKATS